MIKYKEYEICLARDDDWLKTLNYFLATAKILRCRVTVKDSKLDKNFKEAILNNAMIRLLPYKWQKKSSVQKYIDITLTDSIKSYLIKKETLSSWFPPMPEDIELLEENNKVILWTISHENVAFVICDPNDAQILREAGFKISPTERELSQ